MSKRGHIQQHLQKLGEIGDIMRAMKNVSFMGTHKLSRFLEHQRRVLDGIEAAVNDFTRHYSLSGRALREAGMVLAIGSERGFCGDFNEAVANAVRQHVENYSGAPPKILVIGSRLAAKLEALGIVSSVIEGPGVVEEVQHVLGLVMKKLTDMQLDSAGPHLVSLTVLSHQQDTDEITPQVVSPLPAQAHETPAEPYPAQLLLPVQTFHYELVQHYLWAQMHHLFFSSLMAENHARLQHMERSIQRMEEKSSDLRKQQNIIRQEEITEEIEVIMLDNDMMRVKTRQAGPDNLMAGIYE